MHFLVLSPLDDVWANLQCNAHASQIWIRSVSQTLRLLAILKNLNIEIR